MIAGKCNQKPKGFFRPEDQKSPASVWLGLNSILSRQLQPINPHAEKVPGNDNCKKKKMYLPQKAFNYVRVFLEWDIQFISAFDLKRTSLFRCDTNVYFTLCSLNLCPSCFSAVSRDFRPLIVLLLIWTARLKRFSELFRFRKDIRFLSAKLREC